MASSPLLIHYRNLIHAPITEEITFRSLMILILTYSSCLSHNNSSQSLENLPENSCLLRIAFITPLWFAIAHAHHLYEKIFITKLSPSSAILSTLIQLTYTSIFGLIASYLFIITGNIASPIISHMFCNFMGLPDISFIENPNKNNSQYLSYLYRYRYILLFLHALGLILFTIMLTSSLFHNTILDLHIR